MSEIKKAIIATVSFCVLCILVTFALNYFHNKQLESNIENEKGIDLKATFEENSLVITENKEMINNVEVIVPSISGLKDKKVEEQINEEIVGKIREEISKVSDVQSAYCYVEGNFANVLSISISVSYNDYNDHNNVYLNYNLNNGEKIKFEDVFKTNTDILNIIRPIFYEQLAIDKYYETMEENYEENENYTYEEFVTEIDEERFYKLVKNFMNEENKKFSISPYRIVVNFEDLYGYIELKDIADEVVIYDKYVTSKNLYTDNSIGHKNIPVCSNIDFSRYEKFTYGLVEENLWLDFRVNKMYIYEDTPDETRNNIKDFQLRKASEVEEELGKYKKIAKDNKEKFYIVSICLESNVYTYPDDKNSENPKYIYSNLLTNTLYGNVYTMQRELFESKYKEKLEDEYRSQYFGMNNVIYIDNEEDCDKQFEETYRSYNYKTGKEYREVDDLFSDANGYMKTIKMYALEAFDYMDEEYTDEQKEKFLEALRLEIMPNSIELNIDSLDSYGYYISLDEFEREDMRIYE